MTLKNIKYPKTKTSPNYHNALNKRPPRMNAPLKVKTVNKRPLE